MKIKFKHTLLSIALISISFTGISQSVDNIINKHIEAIGGEANWKKVKTMFIVADGFIGTEEASQEFKYTVKASHLKGLRIESAVGGSYYVYLITPKKGWSKNPMFGDITLTSISQEELKQRVDDLDLQGLLLNYQNKGHRVELLGKAEENGKDYYKLKITTKNNNEVVYFIDTETYLIYKQETILNEDGKDIKTVSEFQDYRKIKGDITVPFKLVQGTMTLTNFAYFINVNVDENDFSAD